MRAGAGAYLLVRTLAAGDNHVMQHLSRESLAAGLGYVRHSPQDSGRLVLIVCRPAVGERELPAGAMLDQVTGLAGDNWLARGSASTPDGSADRQRQVTVMNARAAELVAGGTDRMPLAGDQLYLDLDLSIENLPPGSLLAVGQAVLQVSEAPHLGCAKFVGRFGAEAMRFVNSRTGRRLRLRGMNALVVRPGTVRLGDLAAKAPSGLSGHPHLPAAVWRRSRRVAAVVLLPGDQGAEQLGVAQQVHVADVLLADVGMRGPSYPRRLGPVAEQEAGR